MFVWNFLLCSPATATWVVLTQKKKKTCNALVKHKKKIYANLFQIFCHFISRYFHWTMVFVQNIGKTWSTLKLFQTLSRYPAASCFLIFRNYLSDHLKVFKMLQTTIADYHQHHYTCVWLIEHTHTQAHIGTNNL